MLNSTKIDLRRSEVAQELNDLSAKDELTAEDRSKMDALTAEVGDLETRFRAALTAEEALAKSVKDAPVATGLPEADKELAELRSKASFGRAVKDALNERALSGAEAELRSHILPGSPADTIPFEMFPPSDPAAEDRASASDLSDSDVTNINLAGRMFQTPVLDFLDIRPSQVPVGRAGYTFLTAGASPGVVGEGVAIPENAPSDRSLATLIPSRVAAKYDIDEELIYQVENVEELLSSDLRAAIADGLEALIVGNTFSGGFTGLQQSSQGIGGKIAASDTYLSDANSYQEVVAEPYRWLTGFRANTPADIKILCSITGLQFAASLSQTNGDALAAQVIQRDSGGIMATPRLVDATSGARSTANLTDFIVYRTGQPSLSWYAYPMWDGLRVTRDDVTLRNTGRVRVVASVMAAFQLVPNNVSASNQINPGVSQENNRAGLAWGSWRKS